MSKALSRMNKDELIAEAKSYGLAVDTDDTVADLRGMIANARSSEPVDDDESEPFVANFPDPEPGDDPDELRMVAVSVVEETSRTVLWESDPLHPDGEVFISSNGKPVEVGRTPGVLALLESGQLKEHEG